MNMSRLITSILVISMAASLFKFGDQNYQILKTDFGLMGPVFILLTGTVLGLFGVVVFFKALRKV